MAARRMATRDSWPRWMRLSSGAKRSKPYSHSDAWPYGSKPVVVLSKTMWKLKAPDDAVCERMAGTPQQIADQLAQRGLEHLYVDGGVTIQGFLEAGLIQHFIITRIPVLLGSGIPLFGAFSHDIQFKHVSTRSNPNGMVQSEYVIANQGGTAPTVPLLKPFVFQANRPPLAFYPKCEFGRPSTSGPVLWIAFAAELLSAGSHHIDRTTVV